MHWYGDYRARNLQQEVYEQCWTEGRSSTAVAEDLRPTATATVAEV